MAHRSEQPTPFAIPSSPQPAGIRVSLFGGPADGRIVEVQFLRDPVAIYRLDSGQMTALAADAPSADGELLGRYEFVGGTRGPERPVFIHCSN